MSSGGEIRLEFNISSRRFASFSNVSHPQRQDACMSWSRPDRRVNLSSSREACALKRSERANVASSESACSNFKVLPSDPHGFDGDDDGIGCES